MNVLEELARFGAVADSVLPLSKPDAKNLAYLDLVGGIGLDWSRSRKLQAEAVVEHDGRPLLYVVRADQLAKQPDAEHVLNTLRVKLACRGEPAWLAVHRPGELSIYTLSLEPDLPLPRVVRAVDAGAGAFIQDLAAGRLDLDVEASESAFHELLFKLVTGACRALMKADSLKEDPDSVLSLVGRALFTRFLMDRGLLSASTLPDIRKPAEACFSTARSAARVFKWLDETFNGDLLPLADGRYESFFRAMGTDAGMVLKQLTDILYRAPDGQLSIAESWGLIDFAHVPVGLLSEVYEQFAHEHGPLLPSRQPSGRDSLALIESIHYTPRRIARFMLEEAFTAITTCPPHEAKVLDPAAGGGVFLCLAYRKLVALHWEAKGRPTRKQVRQILNQQLTGFDINGSALRLAALGLYLTAIELDPDPASPDGLEFAPLMGKVLILARKDNEAHPNPNILGSLGDAIGPEYNRRYEIVCGNPPWTSWKPANKDHPRDLNREAEDVVRRVASERAEKLSASYPMPEATTFKNADRVPDLPFVWRAAEWAVPNGVIAFALHARLLFKQSAGAVASRNALFRSIQVTGILNGAALRQTEVWPNTDAPWCLLFACNRIPKPSSGFYFVSPVLETALNRSGLMRIDYASAEPVAISVLEGSPGILKLLFRGTAIDAEVVRGVNNRQLPTLENYWASLDLKSGQGYQTVKGAAPPEWMLGMPHLTAGSGQRFAVDVATLPAFDGANVHRARDEDIYRAPVVIIPEAARPERNKGSTLLSTDDVLYSRSFFGYSTSQMTDKRLAKSIAQYLHLLAYSRFMGYWALMTSARFGVERDVLNKEDLDNFPIVPYAVLTTAQKAAVTEISGDIVAGKGPWARVDALVADIYGFSRTDQIAMDDALSVSAPFKAAQTLALADPEPYEEAFLEEMRSVLDRLFGALDAKITVNLADTTVKTWRFLTITCGITTVPDWSHAWLNTLADDAGASRVFVRTIPGHLGVGMRAQQRYWTRTRARLCALDVFRQHADHLLAGKDA